ncbi:MAG: NADH dehydrogenase subunit, partial [Oligoflexia bacterium]|nr:NADH dehydrogenase subunit [Oligoflexia bacterium]
AGECSLQDQYMKFGSYDSSMAESKVKKRKVVDLGSKIVLDTERCILCARCVRFTDEVTKTHELGIFNRGDRSEIGCFKDKPLNNDYAINTVDICPVGALTSKEFRFKQRVWYLKTASSICTGCSTGCSVYVDYNEEGIWRVRPKFNEKVNGHWMCDKGRFLYRDTSRKTRLGTALQREGDNWKFLDSKSAFQKIKKLLEKAEPHFVLTGQYTNEEYQALLDHFPKADFYHWINNEEAFDDFDNLLLRGDRNPNTKGLKKVFPKIKSLKNLEKNIEAVKFLFVLGPENASFFPDIEEKTKLFSKAPALVWMSLIENKYLSPKNDFFQIPIKSFFEKEGTYTNHQGLRQKIKRGQGLSLQAVSIQDCIQFLKSDDFELPADSVYFKNNQFLNNNRKVW